MTRNAIFFIILAAFTAIPSFAQKPSAESIRKRLSLGFGINNDIWMKIPDSISPRKINQGADVFMNYMFPMDKKGHLSFFIGAGFGMHNLYHDALIGIDDNGVSYFYNAPAKVNNYNITVKKSKLSLTYFDIPFGFQYKATNKLHGTLGFKVGWSWNEHSKYKGSDLAGTGYTVKEKELNLRNVETFHYGPYAVIGYKWFGLSVFYQLTSVFVKDYGPQIYPVTVGLVFKPF